MNFSEEFLVDIGIGDGQDFMLDTSNDLATATGNTAIIWGLVRRVLAVRGTWASDRTFGSELYSLLQTKSVQEVADDEVQDIVSDAVAPMIQDGRIDEIVEVSILKRDVSKKSISIKIVARIGTNVLRTDLTVPQ